MFNFDGSAIAVVQSQIASVTAQDCGQVEQGLRAVPFQWDFPTQGYIFPRTLEEAFGPGTVVPTVRPTITPTSVCYTLAVLLYIATIIMLFVG
jgi:hypothetical protein